MKKIITIPISLIGLAGIFFLINHGKTKCSYPVFDLNYEGQVVEACFQASSQIHHQHSNSEMIEIVSPSVSVSGETIHFEDRHEMALFACQIFFQSQKLQPTRYDTSASNPLPGQKIIKVQGQSLFASNSGQSAIIDRLFCMAKK